MKVEGDDIDWTHVFTSGDELAVPGLGVDVKNVAKAGVFVKVVIEPEDGILTLKVWRAVPAYLSSSNEVRG